MAKSLGQIHNVNFRAGTFSAVNEKYNLDLPGQLTDQLQRMVRAGTFHKVVGIDLTAEFPGLTTQGASVSGMIRYYAPTRGRCEAYRSAFKSMAEVMKTQGISMRDNAMYDFRAPLNAETALNTFDNQATLDGTNGLALYNTAVTGASIFGVHNEGVQPTSTTAAGSVFTSGFDTILQGSGGTDFVLNDTLPFTGNHMNASEEYEEIPFTLAFIPSEIGSAGQTVKFEFRPDPALYIAVMCGQMQIVIDELNLVNSSGVVLEVSVQVAGWKSIMGNPDKKRRKPRQTVKGLNWSANRRINQGK